MFKLRHNLLTTLVIYLLRTRLGIERSRVEVRKFSFIVKSSVNMMTITHLKKGVQPDPRTLCVSSVRQTVSVYNSNFQIEQ
jgi:hypothetical protein